jgi:hypothetical protein
MMNTKLRSLLLAVILTTVAGVGLVSAQTTQNANAMARSDALAALPVSDAVAFADVRRILTEIVPRLFAKDPMMLAKMMGALDEVNKKTGVNVLSIERVALGVRFYGPVGPNTKKEDVGIAIIVRGDFDPNLFIAALKRETKGKVTEETYGGKIIYSEPMPAPPKKRSERETPAIVVLDANTIAVGDLAQIRATVDVDPLMGTGRVESALVELAIREPSSLMGGAINVPDALKQSLMAEAPKDEMAQGIVKIVGGIKQAYNSLGATPTDFNIIVGARFESAEQAQSVSDMLLGLRQQAAPHIPDAKIRGLLDSIQITALNDEVQLRCDIKNEVVQNFIAEMMKKGDKPKVTSTKAKTTTKSRRTKRRRRH